MFKEIKYYGEIWLPENESEKYFCVLELLEGKVILETNLSSEHSEYKKELIFGVFNGLGYLTFINNTVYHRTLGVINFRKYKPKYVIVSSDYLIDQYELKINEFKIDNPIFNEWIRSLHWFDVEKDKLEKVKDISHKVVINEKFLDINILKTTHYESNLDSLNIINIGYVSFNTTLELSLLEVIEIYKTFQKFLLFFYGKSKHFKSFEIKLLDCDDWVSLYYNDGLVNEKHSSFITFNYADLKNDLSIILKEWYLNENVQFCSDIVLENLLTVKVSHSRRFTNSLASFEALNKRLGVKHKNTTTEKYLIDFKDRIIEITNIEDALFKTFVKKIIKTRDYYVHGNEKQLDIFSKFELLYISFLIDFIVGIELAKQLGFSFENINKIIYRAKIVFIDMQSTNRILNKNIE